MVLLPAGVEWYLGLVAISLSSTPSTLVALMTGRWPGGRVCRASRSSPVLVTAVWRGTLVMLARGTKIVFSVAPWPTTPTSRPSTVLNTLVRDKRSISSTDKFMRVGERPTQGADRPLMAARVGRRPADMAAWQVRHSQAVSSWVNR